MCERLPRTNLGEVNRCLSGVVENPDLTSEELIGIIFPAPTPHTAGSCWAGPVTQSLLEGRGKRDYAGARPVSKKFARTVGHRSSNEKICLQVNEQQKKKKNKSTMIEKIGRTSAEEEDRRHRPVQNESRTRRFARRIDA